MIISFILSQAKFSRVLTDMSLYHWRVIGSVIPEYCRYDRAAAYDKASLDRIQKPPEKKVNKFVLSRGFGCEPKCRTYYFA